ncbi:TPA: HAD-IA family hydrolase [Vibrio parahaemolyticus]
MSSVEAMLFDLDDTLVSTSKLEKYRKSKDRDGLLQNIEKAKLFAPVPEMLKELKNRSIPLGLVTNAPKWYTSIVLEHFDIDLFDVVICFDDVGSIGAKPSPKGIELALQALGLSRKSRVIYVGDQDTDFVAAYIAGIRPIAPSWAKRDPIAQTPAAIVNSQALIAFSDSYEELSLIADRTATERCFDFEKMQMNFIPLSDKGELVPLNKEDIKLIACGRYFSQNSPLTATLHDNHALSKDIFEKELSPSYTVPQYYVELFSRIVETLPEYTFGDSSAHFDIITVIPSKKEKTPRLENMLNRVKNLAETKSTFISDLFEFKPEASSLKSLGGKEERLKELQSKLFLKSKYEKTIRGKSVLVLDDILTTGSTFQHSFSLLEEQGASFTFGVCLAKTVSVRETIKRCPKCGRVMRIRTHSKNGIHFYGCTGYFETVDKCTHTEDIKVKDCPQCKTGYLRKCCYNGSYFLGCSEFRAIPKCDYTEQVEDYDL